MFSDIYAPQDEKEPYVDGNQNMKETIKQINIKLLITGKILR